MILEMSDHEEAVSGQFSYLGVSRGYAHLHSFNQPPTHSSITSVIREREQQGGCGILRLEQKQFQRRPTADKDPIPSILPQITAHKTQSFKLFLTASYRDVPWSPRCSMREVNKPDPVQPQVCVFLLVPASRTQAVRKHR